MEDQVARIEASLKSIDAQVIHVLGIIFAGILAGIIGYLLSSFQVVLWSFIVFTVLILCFICFFLKKRGRTEETNWSQGESAS